VFSCDMYRSQNPSCLPAAWTSGWTWVPILKSEPRLAGDTCMEPSLSGSRPDLKPASVPAAWALRIAAQGEQFDCAGASQIDLRAGHQLP
jgi:hypothetical protein